MRMTENWSRRVVNVAMTLVFAKSDLLSDAIGPGVIGLSATLIIFALYRMANRHRQDRMILRQPNPVMMRTEVVEKDQPADQRRAATRRRGGMVQVLVRTPRNDKSITAWVVDRSAGGLGITAEREFPRGTHLLVKATDVPLSPWVELEVRHAQRLERE